MKNILTTLLIIFFFINKAYSDITEKIVNNLKNTENYKFKFTQIINEKKETGNCILVFNRKINCKYDNLGKILVSDGKNLIIRNNNSNIPNFYKLEDTTFYKLLDKKYLIDKLKENSLQKNNNKIFIELNYQNVGLKVFFDKEKLHLKGWSTIDIYNNTVLTEIDVQEVNKIIDESLFNLKRFN